MKQPVRSGRAWIPREWRQAIQVHPLRRSAFVVVTGAWNRDEAADVLAGHLPMLPAALGGAFPGAAGEPPGPFPEDDDYDGEDDAYGELPDTDPDHVEDTESARRIARRLSAFRGRRGPVRELVIARAIDVNRPGVYVWRRATPNEPVYRLYPDGGRDAVAAFGQVQEATRSGHLRPRLVAHRYR